MAENYRPGARDPGSLPLFVRHAVIVSDLRHDRGRNHEGQIAGQHPHGPQPAIRLVNRVLSPDGQTGEHEAEAELESSIPAPAPSVADGSAIPLIGSRSGELKVDGGQGKVEPGPNAVRALPAGEDVVPLQSAEQLRGALENPDRSLAVAPVLAGRKENDRPDGELPLRATGR